MLLEESLLEVSEADEWKTAEDVLLEDSLPEAAEGDEWNNADDVQVYEGLWDTSVCD